MMLVAVVIVWMWVLTYVAYLMAMSSTVYMVARATLHKFTVICSALAPRTWWTASAPFGTRPLKLLAWRAMAPAPLSQHGPGPSSRARWREFLRLPRPNLGTGIAAPPTLQPQERCTWMRHCWTGHALIPADSDGVRWLLMMLLVAVVILASSSARRPMAPRPIGSRACQPRRPGPCSWAPAWLPPARRTSLTASNMCAR